MKTSYILFYFNNDGTNALIGPQLFFKFEDWVEWSVCGTDTVLYTIERSGDKFQQANLGDMWKIPVTRHF